MSGETSQVDALNDSILLCIRKMIGPGGDHDFFDTDYVIHINSVIAILRQMGIGPKRGYSITGSSDTWADYLGDNAELLDPVKTYIYLKVKKIFDPPASGTMASAMDNLISELEWRLNVTVDPGEQSV